VTSRPVAAENSSGAELLFPSAHASKSYSASSVPPQRFAAHGNGPLLPGEYSGEVFAVPEIDSRRREEEKASHREPEGNARPEQTEERTGGRHIRQFVAPPAIQVQSLRAAAPPRVDSVRRASAPRSEPDEIHIHIGRIEVAAVAPSPQRAAPPAPRKGINLDEYLRRGSRGQR
jgi:hypothetical protein